MISAFRCFGENVTELYLLCIVEFFVLPFCSWFLEACSNSKCTLRDCHRCGSVLIDPNGSETRSIQVYNIVGGQFEQWLVSVSNKGHHWQLVTQGH